MRKLKKSLTLFAAFLLVFSNLTFVAATPSTITTKEVTKELERRDQISKEELEEQFNPDDEVRVIVEVEGDPAIKAATAKGKKFSDLSEAEKLDLQAKNLATQDKVKQALNSEKLDIAYKQSFATAFNGFSGVVTFKDIEKIEKIAGVKSVTISTEYERPEVEPDMKYSKEIVEAQKTWDEYDYDGEGMIVGVIDSGADPNHRDFILSDDTEPALSKSQVNDYISGHDLPGKYFNEKVPYGHNYMDENDVIQDKGDGASMHGMHVSGTVLANGDEENGGIKGVAPEAQLLAMKVFGNDPNMGSTWGDIYIKAIDDALILGADVVNMSLGSVASFVDPENAEQEAIRNAVENGILFSISAGNSAHLGNGFFNPYASNPDIGVVGAPGLTYESLQVASLENSHMDMDALNFSYGDTEGAAPFLSASSVHPNELDGTFEIEEVGIGDEEGFAGKDLTGKFAFAVRGNTFTDTAYNAMDAGAEGVIVYNHSDGWVSMASEPGITIPQLFMAKTDGDELKAALDAGETVTISFNEETTTVVNELADSMSNFTSWGVTPNLDFKPEITAPGGNILSTLENDAYGSMSGTSMAAPHVAGGSALILERVDNQFDLEGADRVQMAKNILMNTAKPVSDKGEFNADYGDGETPYSPRRQGAGIMQLHAAASTPVVVTEQSTGEAKVALQEVDNAFSFTLVARNTSNEPVSYDVSANLQTDLQIFGVLGNAYHTGALDGLEAAEIVDADVAIDNGNTSVKIPANGSVLVNVDVDLSNAKALTVTDDGAVDHVDPNEIFPNGYFVEGFVTFANEAYPELSVPFVGFNGDWNEAPILDEFIYDGADSFYEQAGFVYDAGDGLYDYLGIDPTTEEGSVENLAISPNDDQARDEIIPVLSFLRNAKSVEYRVLDSNGKELRKLLTDKNVTKNYYDGGSGPTFYLNPQAAWDGTVKDKAVADGEYFIEIAATIDYEGKDAQTVRVPVKVDTAAPTLMATLKDKVATLHVADELSGVSHIEVMVDGELVDIVAADANQYTFDELSEDNRVTFVAVDYAGNETTVDVSNGTDGDIPNIYVETPETFEAFNTNEVQITGTVEDKSEIVEFTISGEDVELTKESQGVYSFDTVQEFEDGVNKLEVYAKDEFGNEASLSNSRSFYVDTAPAVIDVAAPGHVKHDVASVEMDINVTDNAENLRLYLDGSEIAFYEESGYDMVAIDETENVEVSLEPGQNTFEVKAVDLAGNETVEQVKIYRATSADDEAVSRLYGDSRYKTAVALSKDGWDSADTVVLARGDDFADALAGVPLAHKFDAPLLLTQTDRYTPVTKEEIERLGASTVYVLGGVGAINETVESELKAQGIEVVRVSGDSRDATAAEIATIVTDGEPVDEVVLVNGYNFPDAVSIAAYAAEEGMPILLTQDGRLPQATQTALYDLKASETLVIGGKTAIHDSVLRQVPKANRVSGADRFATSVEIAKHFDLDTKEYYVTTGMEFPDALAAAAIAAKDDTGVILVGKYVHDYMEEFITAKDFDILTIVGGQAAVSDEIFDEFKRLID
ncbi:cell wall-binding repeat-containing protein [Oceanobacillus alkalisoli]|uniref:cell wall-binding repeat-containing protein n=1 Tax=Oceanobacillus alkalisoli TaxID=2925113 RepID=UPI001EE48718|nr:cell wall-binding repeat-containing protein [Oceanobacillus alkalisoli]MCG5102644.1 S8 family serine peptidase [Oceanobacillus alkalisoli]